MASSIILRRWLYGGGFHEYLVRFAALLPLLRVATAVLPASSPLKKWVMSILGTFALLAVHLMREVRNMRVVGRGAFERTKAQVDGLSPEEINEVVVERDRLAVDVRHGQHSGIVWRDDEKKARTDLSIVFIHGWSASRFECSPLCEELARELGANLYFARLPGHGRAEINCKDEEVTLFGLVTEAAQALAVGQSLGKRVLLVGCSTGAALSAWLCTQLLAEICGCVLISTNVWTKPVPLIRNVRMFPVLRDLVLMLVRGYTWRGKPLSVEHENAWSLTYQSALLAAVFDVSAMLSIEDPERCAVPTLAFHCPADPLASFEEANRYVRKLPRGKMEVVDTPEHPHCVVGNILSPSTVSCMLSSIVEWAQDLA
eukprot:TRINITY_DN14487_c0_g3_i2.p1 TRINITY_DN14487_c0_g3~~TRINITY_DN14487_c0_g3_i2.p1  ORF type:complete len:385 (-),score=42.02 TRINITY_DN14487_c0_g3_i2:163-1278(-)